MRKTRDKSVLVVDDDPAYLSALRLSMRTCGFNAVYTATDGAEALDCLDYLSVDLIISDWNMVPIDGLGLLRTVRRRPATAKTPFILMSGNLSEAGWREAIELGVTEFLIKPFPLSALRTACFASYRSGEQEEQANLEPQQIAEPAAEPPEFADTDGRRASREAVSLANTSPNPTERYDNANRWTWASCYLRFKQLLNEASP